MLLRTCVSRFILAGFILAIPSHAAQYPGRVNMTGSIFESTCSIDTSSRYQEIFISLAPTGLILANAAPEALLSFKLVGCETTLSAGHYVATLYGDEDNYKNFVLTGSATGISLRIANSRGDIVHPGVPMQLDNEIVENNKINYILTLTGNGRELMGGNYHSTLRLKIDYY